MEENENYTGNGELAWRIRGFYFRMHLKINCFYIISKPLNPSHLAVN